jgi:hypothetical protein
MEKGEKRVLDTEDTSPDCTKEYVHPFHRLEQRHEFFGLREYSVGCGSTVDIRMRQKVVVLSELQRAIIYTTR